MKLPLRLVLFAAAFCLLAPSSGAQGWMESYNRLLGKYATSGGVKYAEWKSNAGDMQALQAVVDGIAKENASGMERKQQLAFYFNAYNAWILHEALEKYPTKSVKDTLFTFFTSKRITVAGQQTSFKAFEDNVIRKLGRAAHPFRAQLREPQLSAARPAGFTAGNLDGQFETLAQGLRQFGPRRAVSTPANKTAELSKIFDWYKDDFKGDGGPVAFINKRRSTPIPADAKISYQEYDWGLNEVK